MFASLHQPVARRFAVIALALTAAFASGCATSPELPDNPAAAEKLRKPDSDYDVHGELGVTYGRSI